MTSVAAEHLVQRLRSRGVRITAPRRMVVEVLVDASTHLTAEEIHHQVRATHPDVSESSIYRTMELLGEHGIVDHVHLGHGPAQFHLAGDPHAHLVCDGCGRIGELDRDLAARFAVEVARLDGFAVDLGHFALTGRCDACRLPSDKMQP